MLFVILLVVEQKANNNQEGISHHILDLHLKTQHLFRAAHHSLLLWITVFRLCLYKPSLHAGHQNDKERSVVPNQPIFCVYNYQRNITMVAELNLMVSKINISRLGQNCFEHMPCVAFGTEVSTIRLAKSTSHSIKRRTFIRSRSHRF